MKEGIKRSDHSWDSLERKERCLDVEFSAQIFWEGILTICHRYKESWKSSRWWMDLCHWLLLGAVTISFCVTRNLIATSQYSEVLFYPFFKNWLYFLEHFKVHSKIEWKAQRVLMCPLPRQAQAPQTSVSGASVGCAVGEPALIQHYHPNP